MDLSDKKLEDILISQGHLTPAQIASAIEQQRKQGGSLRKTIVEMNLLSDETIVAAALAHENIAHIRLKNYPIRHDVAKLLPRDKCLAYRAIPIALSRDLLTVATADPFNVVNLDDLHRLLGKEILPVYATEAEIQQTIDKYHPPDRMTMTDVVQQLSSLAEAETAREALLAEGAALNKGRDAEEEEENGHSPLVVMLANKIIEDAYHQGASDIHIEQHEQQTVVRYRVDGNLREALVLPPKIRNSLTARLKIMADLDISEKRLPQDGRILYKNFTKSNLDIDIRISTMPTAWGEKTVMRLLDKRREGNSLDGAGFLPDTLKRYRELIHKPWGMLLHVGPTGSGKTTTLYAALAEINDPETNIQTAEDPIEYLLPGINQTQVHPDIGFTFARALRGFLRQDPDVIMIGEIRDLETAKIAVEAALTGHLLFSTLHTNDAPQTVTRLVEIGVEPFLISATLLGVCAQRLARRLCQCKQRYEPKPDELQIMNVSHPVDVLYKARGCGLCRNTGFKGRLGIHELLTLSDGLRDAINHRQPASVIREIAVREGMRSLFQDAVQKVLQGHTTLEEVLSVVRDI